MAGVDWPRLSRSGHFDWHRHDVWFYCRAACGRIKQELSDPRSCLKPLCPGCSDESDVRDLTAYSRPGESDKNTPTQGARTIYCRRSRDLCWPKAMIGIASHTNSMAISVTLRLPKLSLWQVKLYWRRLRSDGVQRGYSRREYRCDTTRAAPKQCFQHLWK